MGLLLALVLTVSPALEPAREAYQSGELSSARSQLEALLQPLQVKDASEEAEARLLLAATYHAQEELERAEPEVVRALAADPDAKLDPLVFPPDFIAYVERVHVLHRQRISELSAERRAPPDLTPSRPAAQPPPPESASQVPGSSDAPTRDVTRSPPPSVWPATSVTRSPPSVSPGWYLVPFGVGHFKHGQHTKGTFLAVTQGTAFAVSVASLGTAWAIRGPDGLYDARDGRLARGLNVSYLVSAYAFAALYAYGILDGWLLSPEPPAVRGPQG
ncbi:hypothetical protein [Pyxidicoccus parkwayensis]|nr:hypothetical protein [Pyxidicoccus parkwaysis]